MRTRVDDRAQKIYDFLKGRLGRPYRVGDLLARVDLTDNATNRAALRRVKYLAEKDGLCCPYPTSSNGYTYTVTDDPTAALDPALHLARGQQGLEIPKTVYQDFVKSRMSKLEPGERKVAKAWMDFEDKVKAVNSGAAELTKAIIAMRREDRDRRDDT
jgi:hypothetical protein